MHLALIPPAGSIFAVIWFWLNILIALIWLRRHFDLNRADREPVLRASKTEAGGAASTGAHAPGDSDELPRLSVLVAAKDEEANIGRCVEGLLRQEYPDFELIVVNDRSSDATGQIIDAAASRDSRMRAVHVRSLPDGWFGKNNALREGLLHARGEWLAFSDADCAYDSPHLLTAAMRFARRNSVDLLSVLPRLEAFTFWEKVVQPPAGAILVFWFPPQRVNNPRSRTAYANGAFMLMSRQTYEALGGHEAVKATLNEDMHFARRCKAAGKRLYVIRGHELYRVRMYTGFQQIWRGWSRIFYGCFGTFPRLLASAMFLTLFSLSPYLSLLLAGPMGALTRNLPAAGWVAAAAALAVLAQQSILWRYYRLAGLRPAWALSWPLGASLCIGMTMNAMRRLAGARTTWRGTSYAGGAR